jgi:phage protein D
VDDERLRIWRRMAIRIGYPPTTETIADGYVTHVEVLVSEQRQPYLEVSGMDASVLMDLEERQTAWPNKKDSEIAREIFGSHGLTADVGDTEATHPEDTATVLQSETDIRFLRRLAARNGFECRVHGRTGVFRAPDLREPPQKLLAVAFGLETNLVELAVRVDGTPPTTAEIRRVDPIEKAVEAKRLAATTRRRLGREALSALRGEGPEARMLVQRHAAVSAGDMEARLAAAYEAANRFVTAEGEIDSRVYRSVLRAGRLVTIKGAGESHSGLYYVARVRHTLTPEAYAQRFTAHRNGLGLLGDESFAGSGQPLALSLGG